MSALCFVDTETDGIHPHRCVWEIALIRREPDGRETTAAFFVELALDTADPFGLRVGRFYDRHPLGRYLSGQAHQLEEPQKVGTYLTREAAAHKVARFTHAAHIVGAVPNFDTEALDALLRWQDLAPAWHYHLVDVENLAVGFLAGRGEPVAPPWSSEGLSLALGVEPAAPEERHTALGDARWAMRVYDAVMSGGPS
jgi:hypothetical protein